MGQLLEQINSPDDLKKLSIEELPALADEIRQFMLSSISKTGGHLASNLGMVELTLALHYVFDFKTDSLLWDVGHQCYAHKIIAGRKNDFSKLRQPGGISGFPDPAESIYDSFTVGHAGTSISTAIGMALGSHAQNKDKNIVALVGDASIVNGTSFEALNNLGLVKRQLLIILNDNSMAIDATQGAVAKYFSKIRLSQTYEDLRKTTNNILDHLPVIGKSVEEAIEKIKKSIRMVLPGSQLFESMNIPYFGPVDGHDIESLISLFKGMDHLDHPAILHVHTTKGKGFTPAENNTSGFHSTGPFDINGTGDIPENGSATPKRTFTNVFSDALTELAEKDERIVAITSAMCDGTGLVKFKEKFPDRFYDVGIAESVAVDIAAGMAKTGLKPVVCIYSTFLQRSFDQIFQEVSLQNLPVIFCIDRAGLVGSDGPTHHGMMDTGFLRMMPNMVLTAPATDVEMKLALEFAINSKSPICLRYPKDYALTDKRYPELASNSNEPYELGKSVAVREGIDSSVAIVTYGAVLAQAIDAATILAKEGIEVDIINARFAAPIDDAIISLLDSGKAIITVEDHRLSCGFGSALLERACEIYNGAIPGQIQILALPKRFISPNTRKAQIEQSAISVENIAESARNMAKISR